VVAVLEYVGAGCLASAAVVLVVLGPRFAAGIGFLGALL
jgi:hypothetical protein